MQMQKPISKVNTNFGRSGRRFFTTERDKAVLRFLWKWKLASTASLHEAVGRPNSPYSTYKVLERLARHKYVEVKECDDDRSMPWQLTLKGFESIRNVMGDLCEEGYLSENHWHDRNVMAFQLGEWSTHQLPIVNHFTEQEMRRRLVDYYPPWVPQIKDHRADGYTKITTEKGDVVLAYEVELWAKSLAIYESTLRFYKLIRNLNRVYWLIGDPLVKDQLLRAKNCVHDDSNNFHVFIDLKEYLDVGWDARVTNERSETLFTIRENMQELCGKQYRDYIGNKGGPSRVSVHYDASKVLGKKRT